MNRLLGFCICFLGVIAAYGQAATHVVLISIDGLHPDMYLDSTWPTPNLRALMKGGTYADHMLSVFPAYTYPSHTAMITGALPARSKICFNQPKGNHGEWNWFAKYIQSPTLWQALAARGLTTAAIMWPGGIGGEITYNISEIWSVDHPANRITEARRYATPPDIVEEIDRTATGALDSTNMDDGYLGLDENAGRAAAYIFRAYRPSFLALHFAEVDGFEHDRGRDGDSVRLAVEADDRAIGELLETIERSGEKDSTVVSIVGDHGFSTIHIVCRPNMLIRNVPAKFIAAGGSCFLYRTGPGDLADIVQGVKDSLKKLPADKRALFKIMEGAELDQLGVDSAAILALSAVPGVIFGSALGATGGTNHGLGTSTLLSPMDEVFIPARGGHHGYDPRFVNVHGVYSGRGRYYQGWSYSRTARDGYCAVGIEIIRCAVHLPGWLITSECLFEVI
jgi:predicted AlkP superfamily pyrophosphatase or phosphodiesterase